MGRHSCDEAIAQVYLYLDDEMGWLRKTRIKRHLRKCNGCLRAFNFEGHLKAVVRERAKEEPRPEVLARLRRFLEENEPGFGR